MYLDDCEKLSEIIREAEKVRNDPKSSQEVRDAARNLEVAALVFAINVFPRQEVDL